MKVTIDHKEHVEHTGIIFTKEIKSYICQVTVEFSEEEKAIIQNRNLGSMKLKDRPLPPGEFERIANITSREHAQKVQNGSHLYVYRLVEEPRALSDSFPTPALSKQYEAEAVEILKNLKSHIEASATISTGPKTIEI